MKKKLFCHSEGCARRILSIALCLVMVMSLLPTTAWAATGVTEGSTYYFDLSSENGNVGGIYDQIPDTTLHYVPFTYVGTINAYSLDSSSSGDITASNNASASNRTLFVSDYTLSTWAPWDNLNAKGLIFGKTFDTNYKLRSLSAGNDGVKEYPTRDYIFASGLPASNEWDTILTKNPDYIKNRSAGLWCWGQDTASQNNWRVMRGYYDTNTTQDKWQRSYSDKASDCGFRPALEVLNSATLKSVTLNLNGGTFDSKSSINIVCAGGSFTAPSGQELTAPTGKVFKSWNTAQTGSGTSYNESASVPNTVTTLYAQWKDAFTAVTDITGVPATGTVGTAITLSGTVAPNNATNKTIAWSIANQGGTDSTLSDSQLTAAKAGTVTVKATITNGATATTAYTQDFKITISRKAYTGGIATAPSSIVSKTDTTVQLTAVTGTGIEYGYNVTSSTTGITNWQTSTSFSNLTGGTPYYFFTRYAQTDSTEAGGTSGSYKVTTKTAPAASGTVTTPVVDTSADKKPTSTSITISTVKGNEYCITTENTPDWSNKVAGTGDKYTFTGLTQGTKYYIHTRVAETDDSMPSASVNKEQYTLPTTPAASVVTIHYTNETIAFADTLEVSTSAGFESGKMVSSGGAVLPNTTYYVRVKAISGGAPASEATSFKTAARPTAPGAVLDKDITKTDTKITVANTVSTQQYSKDNGTTWQDNGSFTGLSANTDYTIVTRVKAVEGKSFASENSTALTVKTKTAPAGANTVTKPQIAVGDSRPTDTQIIISTKLGNEYYISTSETPPADWSGKNYYLESQYSGSHTFTGLTQGTKYYIHVRVAETATAMPSASAYVEQYTLPTTPAKAELTIDYANETISFANTLEVYNQVEGKPGSSITTITPTNEPQTVYVRVKAISGGAPASEWQEVTIPARPENKGNVTVDNAAEKVTVPADYSYKIGNGTEVVVTGSSKTITLNPSEKITWWKTATDSAFKSDSDSVTAPARLDKVNSTTFVVNGKTEKLPTTTAMQYSTDNGATWKDCTADMALTDFGWDGTAAVSVQVRMKATTGTDGKYASESITYSIAARATAPSAERADETIFGKHNGALIKVSDTMEFQKSGATGWTDCGGSTVTSLEPGTYYVRVKATDNVVYSNQQALTIVEGRKLKLTFDEKDGSAVTDIENIEWQQTVTVPTTTRTGYTFGGWFSNLSDETTKLTAATKIEADTTYLAKWTANTYTVTFNANTDKATGEMSTQTHTYDAALRLTANVFERDNYTFSGWNTKADGTGTSYADEQSVKNLLTEQDANLNLYAQWTEAKRHNLGGTVTDGTNQISGATVKLMQGADTIATTITDSEGKYAFTNLLPGTYNLVVIKGDKIITVLYVVEKADATESYTQNVTIPTAATNSSSLTVKKDESIKEDAPKIVVGGLETVATDKSADITMTVTQKAEDKESNEQKEISKAANQNIGMYLDVTLKAGENALTDTDTVLEIVIPYNFSGKTNVKVWRNHNSAVDKFDALKEKPASPFTDKTFFADMENNQLYIYANKFSTYAVSYTTVITNYPVTVDSANIKNGTVTVSPTNATSGNTVTITVKPDAGYVLKELIITDENGKNISYTDNKNGTFSFTQPSGKVNISATFVKAESPFTDVATDAYYYDAVLWAKEKGITGGTSATTFAPNATCTRAQAVTFLWRAMGSPEPTSKTSPFTDVKADAYYYKAVLWAVEKGITKGTSDTTFTPDAVVTRGQSVTFLWRTAGSPAATKANAFTDVEKNAYYYDAVLWAAEKGITGGTSATNFSPANPCSRGQIVTFLYRYLNK